MITITRPEHNDENDANNKLDNYYNFKRSYLEAKSQLNLAMRYVDYDTETYKALMKLEEAFDVINFE